MIIGRDCEIAFIYYYVFECGMQMNVHWLIQPIGLVVIIKSFPAYLLEASDELRDDCTDEGRDPRRLGEGGAGNPA